MNTINVRNYIKNKGNYPLLHPYSTNNTEYFDRINIVEGSGIYLTDANGKRYIDAASGLWNVFLGYGNKRIEDSMIEQIKKLSYCSLFEYTNSTVIKAASMLLNMLGNSMKKVIFGCSGSESIECAIKIMRCYWYYKGVDQKKVILSFSGSYHGTYYGAFSVSGLQQEFANDFSPILPQIEYIDPRYENSCCNNCTNCNESCLRDIRVFFEKESYRIAGIVIEPILSSKGALIPCKRYLRQLVQLCKENDILVTFDEVALGFYRTAVDFYFKKLNIEPDILCLSKGMNSGYLPLGATVINERINEVLREEKVIFLHGSTQGGNPVACASMIATMEELELIKSKEDMEKKADFFYEILKESVGNLDSIGDIRYDGFLYAIDIVNEKVNVTGKGIKDELMRNGLLTYHYEEGILLLPMCITTYEQWNEIVSIITKVIQEIG